MRFLQPIRERVHGLLTQPLEELTRAQRSFRYILDFGRYCAQELRADRAGEMAAALTYHTLFSLLPTIVLMLVVLQIAVNEEKRENLKQNVVEFALQGILPDEKTGSSPLIVDDPKENTQQSDHEQVETPASTTVQTTAPNDGQQTVEEIRANLTSHIQYWISELEKIDFASIGAIGVLVFIYAATKLLTTIEHSFNRIFDAPYGRPLYVRLPLYYTAITLAPLLLLAGQYAQTIISGFIETNAQATGLPTSWVGEVSTLLTPFATTMLLLLLLYRFLPNTKVNTRSAATGAFVAALGWIIIVELFKIYVASQGTSNIYGALALVPLFLLWIWLTWLIVLFGVEVTYTIQAMDGRRFKSLRAAVDRDVLFDPRWMIPLVALIGRNFENGNPVRLNELQFETGLPNRAIASLIDLLTKANIVHHVEHGEPGVPAYTLARPPERIGIDELVDISGKVALREKNRARLTGIKVIAHLHTAQVNAAKGTTLADVMNQDPA